MDRNRKRGEREDDTPPCRTIFLRNVQFETTENQVRDVFEQYGDLKSLFSLINKRGLCFITFVSREMRNEGAGLIL
jgi:RNA recognition motif-containing protein